MRSLSLANGLGDLAQLSLSSNPVMSNESLKINELRDFFGKPERSFFRLSSDGKTLGFMQPFERRENLHVVPLPPDGSTPDFTKARRLTAETEPDIAGYFWKGNGHILYVKDFGGDENFHVVAVDVHSGEVKDLTPLPRRSNLILVR